MAGRATLYYWRCCLPWRINFAKKPAPLSMRIFVKQPNGNLEIRCRYNEFILAVQTASGRCYEILGNSKFKDQKKVRISLKAFDAIAFFE
jgi:hypothetical protein